LESNGSIGLFSQQGFEAAHKWHKRIYFRSTFRNGFVSTKKVFVSSIEQTLMKIYRMRVMKLARIDPQFKEELKDIAEEVIVIEEIT